MTRFIAFQSTYNELQIGLFKDKDLLDFVTVSKMHASKNCIPLVDQLLSKHAIQLNDLSFIGVNLGPSPFTSLRVVIATVNGLAFATQIPLIGIDGLRALLKECKTEKNIVALLNAFNKEVYYGFKLLDQSIATGYGPIETIKENLKNIKGPILLIGQGVQIFENDLKPILSEKITIGDPFIEFCSLQQLGSECFESFMQGNLAQFVAPLYLKQCSYKSSVAS